MKKILTLFLAAALLVSCSDDDGPQTNQVLVGSWHMEAYTTFAPELPELEPGDVTWTFTEGGTKLTVVNTVEDTYPSILASGSYNITLYGNSLKINGGTPYDFSIGDGLLFIWDTHETGDGPHMKFTRQ